MAFYFTASEMITKPTDVLDWVIKLKRNFFHTCMNIDKKNYTSKSACHKNTENANIILAYALTRMH